MLGTGFGAIVSRAGGGILISLAFGVVLSGPPDPVYGKVADKAADCLKSPKATAPQGERWYYRVERGTKRHCWYTRAEVSRKFAAPIPKPDKAVEAPTEPAPLQASVANARAEADLSDLPRPGLGTMARGESVTETPPPPAWTLAERWSNRADADPPTQMLPMRLVPPAPAPTAFPDANEETPDDNLQALAAGTIGLLGLSTVLIATLILRRKRERTDTNWHFGQRTMLNVRPNLTVTDLNDEPLMTWRKGMKNELRLARQTPGQYDAVIRRIRRLT